MLTRILAYVAYLKLAGWIAHLILSAGKAQSPEEPLLGFDETRQQPTAARLFFCQWKRFRGNHETQRSQSICNRMKSLRSASRNRKPLLQLATYASGASE